MAAERAEETQETGELDDKFVVLAEDEEEECGVVQFESEGPTGRVLVYVGRKGRSGRFYRSAIPISTFVDLAREVVAKVDAGEIEVE